MKVKFKTHFAATVQAQAFNPVTGEDSIEIEMEVEDEKELLERMEHFEKIIREKVIKSTLSGVREINEARTEMLDNL